MKVLLRNPKREVELPGGRSVNRLLNEIERESPGAKSAFYLNFLSKMSPVLAEHTAAARGDVGACAQCGAPTTGDVCAFCRLVDNASTHELVPVEFVLDKRIRR